MLWIPGEPGTELRPWTGRVGDVSCKKARIVSSASSTSRDWRTSPLSSVRALGAPRPSGEMGRPSATAIAVEPCRVRGRKKALLLPQTSKDAQEEATRIERTTSRGEQAAREGERSKMKS